MYFKPTIFLSSRLNGLINLRKKIKKILQKAGADVVTYEDDLTPSTKELTYRYDIKKSDFVLFIIDENGNPTNSGLSGTEEELLLAIENKIPYHIYLKKDFPNDNKRKLYENIKKSSASYYIYKDENDLIKRIKSTIFIIAYDILSNDYRNYYPLTKKKIKSFSFNNDYLKAEKFLQEFTEFDNLRLPINKKIPSLVGLFDEYENDTFFFDKELDSCFEEAIDKYLEISNNRSNDYTPLPGPIQKIKTPHYNFIIKEDEKCPSTIYTKFDYLLEYEEFKKRVLKFEQLVGVKKSRMDNL